MLRKCSSKIYFSYKKKKLSSKIIAASKMDQPVYHHITIWDDRKYVVGALVVCVVSVRMSVISV